MTGASRSAGLTTGATRPNKPKSQSRIMRLDARNAQRQRRAVVNAVILHGATNMSTHGALTEVKRVRDLLVGETAQQQLLDALRTNLWNEGPIFSALSHHESLAFARPHKPAATKQG